MVAGTLPVLQRVATLAALFQRNIYPASKLSCPLARFASLTCNFISSSLPCGCPEDENRNKNDPGHCRGHPFLSLCFQGGRAWLSLHEGFWIREKGSLGFFTFCREVITVGNRNKGAPLGILLVLSLSCSLQRFVFSRGESASSACSIWLPWPDFEKKAF